MNTQESVALHKWHVFGRRTTPKADMELAKSWLQSCATSHKDCQNALFSKMPTRILDLRPPSCGSTLDLRLSANPDHRAPYVALSHCWGTSQPLKLLKGNYGDFQNRILYDELPRTFQDAVAATRALGLRYLWIDSLCIIQDSEHDWEEQCTKMRQIYRNSFVTIAGPAASSCDSGFLNPRPRSYETTLPISWWGTSDELIFWYQGIDEFPMEFVPEPNAPLSNRAWALQERLLYTRVLYFGTKQMYLECFTNVRFESFHYPIEWDHAVIGITTKLPMDTFWSRRSFLGFWKTLVETYSRLALTKITDRLPALSGLASAFQAAPTSQYLAGIWHDDLPRGLIWFVPPWGEGKAIPATGSLTDYVAPSWSWAAAKFGVRYLEDTYGDQFQHDFDILDAAVRPTGLDPFGMVKDGYIEGSGRIRTFLVQQKPDLFDDDRLSLYVLSKGPEFSIVASFAPDVFSTEDFQECEISLLYIGMFTSASGVAMSLEEVEGEGSTFKRTGLAFTNFPDPDPDVHIKFRELFQETEKSRVRLV
ncbi:heterokaryon incompatibility protein-domain-containing protein [Stachybotrys elegans]|uniref:Heterokaryon incompatibility protein-domain-containing protein n=1 Tax=Stachybotrys elegans TaxID=80388 RepID=A0A8K0T0Y5_9HYPO|nr:heterokaryon incompatibility protein-domain-containing protein [Stachybotrys elegans]